MRNPCAQLTGYFPELHTLGCVYAELAKTKEARQVLKQAMDEADSMASAISPSGIMNMSKKHPTPIQPKRSRAAALKRGGNLSSGLQARPGESVATVTLVSIYVTVLLPISLKLCYHVLFYG